MSEVPPVGATLPDGIDVDEAAAYFGVTESSASLHTLLEMDSESALSLFLELTSDLHLAKGDFDFNTASERMNCEGGEIYFLVVGHLGMLELVDPLRFWLGMETSDGEPGGPDPGLDESSRQSIETIADPMNVLQLLSIAHLEGGDVVVKKYYAALKGMFASPSSSVDSLKLINSSLSAVLHSYQGNGAIVGIPSLSDAPLPAAAPSLPPPQTPTPAEPVVKTSVAPPQVSVKKEEYSVPLPGSVVEKPQLEPTPPPMMTVEDIVPLPISKIIAEPAHEKKITETEGDAFAGAFGLVGPKAPHVAKEIQVVEQPTEEQSADIQPSMESMLSGITTSGRGDVTPAQLPSIEAEVQPSQNIENLPKEVIEEVEQVSEQQQQPASHSQSTLPKPVMAAPVRTPVGGGMPRATGPTLGQHQQIATQQAAINQQQLAAQQAAINQQQLAAQQEAINQQQLAAQQDALLQQQRAAQQSQQGQTELPSPTIKSGVHCQGCGIGLDPNWNNCPVCGLGQF
ncbi:zinc ribbon domain-containing protein [Deltaproteobacteria bacterium]|nr:zinc ribbon domain-containing protein [Deltaproteobacteria bacterium]